MIHSAVMRVGSRHITNDLAILLKSSLETAEQIKVQLGVVNERWDRRKKPELVDLSAYMDEPFAVQRRDLMGAIEAARARELLDMVQEELKKAGKDGLCPLAWLFPAAVQNFPDSLHLHAIRSDYR